MSKTIQSKFYSLLKVLASFDKFYNVTLSEVIIMPVVKKGSTGTISYCISISLTCTASKIMERIVAKPFI